jgi:hypothetical protein
MTRNTAKHDTLLDLLYAPLTILLVYCHINSFRRASSCGEAWPGSEKRIGMPNPAMTSWIFRAFGEPKLDCPTGTLS